ncbi:hypothetical protein K2X89_06545 [Myxococcota bacterium]|nr:hypothetical protein [Myxococcota bacterium]
MSQGPIVALELQPSEAHVLAAASRLLAARLGAGGMAVDPSDDEIDRCVRIAIRLAVRVDRLLQSDAEATGLGPRDPALSRSAG